MEEAELLCLKPRKAWQAVSNVIKAEMMIKGFERLTPEKQRLVRLTEMHAEVANGGFSQYFTNSMGRHHREVLEHLKALDCRVQWQMLDRFVARLRQMGIDPGNRDQVGRFVFGSEEERQFEQKLNEEYYRHMDLLYAAVVQFILQHKNVFGIQ